jgi:hypothetical protein
LTDENAQEGQNENTNEGQPDAAPFSREYVEGLRQEAAGRRVEARELRAALDQERVRGAVIAAAARLGFADPEDAARLADLNDVTIGEDGAVQGIDPALEALAGAKPYLLRGPSGGASTLGPTNPAGGESGPDLGWLHARRTGQAGFGRGGVIPPHKEEA